MNGSYGDAIVGMADAENRPLYGKEVEKRDEGWGVQGRMTTYAGSGVGLVTEIKRTGEIVREVREGIKRVLDKTRGEVVINLDFAYLVGVWRTSKASYDIRST